VKPVSPGLEVIDPFFGLPQARERWNLDQLTAAQEMELGRQLNEMVRRFNRQEMTGALVRRVREAAEPLLTAVSRKQTKYRFMILDSKTINAFSHPGGYVYVTSGLLNWISEDENYALQFALAHEIYHVDRRHALKCLQDPGLRKEPAGTLSLFYLYIFPWGYYPEQMDFDADAWALQQLQKLGCTRRECLMFIRKWEMYAQDNNFLEGHAKPQSGEVASLFENHYRAHPSALTRLKKLESLYGQPLAKPK
jgi:predicted Zn-dependent protease